MSNRLVRTVCALALAAPLVLALGSPAAAYLYPAENDCTGPFGAITTQPGPNPACYGIDNGGFLPYEDSYSGGYGGGFGGGNDDFYGGGFGGGYDDFYGGGFGGGYDDFYGGGFGGGYDDFYGGGFDDFYGGGNADYFFYGF